MNDYLQIESVRKPNGDRIPCTGRDSIEFCSFDIDSELPLEVAIIFNVDELGARNEIGISRSDERLTNRYTIPSTFTKVPIQEYPEYEGELGRYRFTFNITDPGYYYFTVYFYRSFAPLKGYLKVNIEEDQDDSGDGDGDGNEDTEESGGNNSTLWWLIGGGIGLLLLIVIIVVIVLMMNRSKNKTTESNV